MSAEAAFSACNLIALVGWLALLAAPANRRVTLATGTVIPLTLAAVYLVVLAIHIRGSRGGFSTLQGVAELFSNPWLLLAGWVHYLAFDLFVGTWEARDASDRGVSRLLLTPCLMLTFFFGPVGFLCYHSVRRLRRQALPG